jgi:hypothetical protein
MTGSGDGRCVWAEAWLFGSALVAALPTMTVKGRFLCKSSAVSMDYTLPMRLFILPKRRLLKPCRRRKLVKPGKKYYNREVAAK